MEAVLSVDLASIHHSLAETVLKETVIQVDVDRIMTVGDSAGGYLSLYVGLNHPDDIRAATAAYPARIIQFYPHQQSGLSPLVHRLDSGDTFPPCGVLVWHGKDDTVVPVEGSLKLKQKIEAVDPELNFELVIRDGEHWFDHGINLDEDWVVEALQNCVNSWR